MKTLQSFTSLFLVIVTVSLLTVVGCTSNSSSVSGNNGDGNYFYIAKGNGRAPSAAAILDSGLTNIVTLFHVVDDRPDSLIQVDPVLSVHYTIRKVGGLDTTFANKTLSGIHFIFVDTGMYTIMAGINTQNDFFNRSLDFKVRKRPFTAKALIDTLIGNNVHIRFAKAIYDTCYDHAIAGPTVWTPPTPLTIPVVKYGAMEYRPAIITLAEGENNFGFVIDAANGRWADTSVISSDPMYDPRPGKALYTINKCDDTLYNYNKTKFLHLAGAEIVVDPEEYLEIDSLLGSFIKDGYLHLFIKSSEDSVEITANYPGSPMKSPVKAGSAEFIFAIDLMVEVNSRLGTKVLRFTFLGMEGSITYQPDIRKCEYQIPPGVGK